MFAKADYFVGNEFLGTGQWELELTRDGFESPRSWAFFCARCGEVWARIVVENGTEFHVWTMTCGKHPPRWRTEVPGSLWQIWDKRAQMAMPRRILLREVELHLNWFLSQQGNMNGS